MNILLTAQHLKVIIISLVLERLGYILILYQSSPWYPVHRPLSAIHHLLHKWFKCGNSKYTGWIVQKFGSHIGSNSVLSRDIFSCDQAALRTLLSVCQSIRLLHLFHNVPLIVSSFQELLPMTDVMHASGQAQRSKVKATEVKTQLNHFRTVTPVWIPFKVIFQISRSHG